MNSKLKRIGLTVGGSIVSAILMIALAYLVEPNINWFYDNQNDFTLLMLEWSILVSIIPTLLFLFFAQKCHIRHLYLFLAGFTTFLLFIALVFTTSAIEQEIQRYVRNPIFEKCTDVEIDVRKCRFKFPVEFFGG